MRATFAQVVDKQGLEFSGEQSSMSSKEEPIDSWGLGFTISVFVLNGSRKHAGGHWRTTMM